MPNSLAARVNGHYYPELFFRQPWLMAIWYGLSSALTLRNRYIQHTVKRMLRQFPKPIRLLDVGCGDGSFLLGAAGRYPEHSYTGIDKAEGNIRLCKHAAVFWELKNCSFVQDNIADHSPENQLDMILCVSVLQYLTDDLACLKRFHQWLVHNGLLLLYVPINEQRLLPFYDALMRKFSSADYDRAQGKQHNYTTESICRLVGEAGFCIERTQFTYGLWGKLYYEPYSLLLAWLKKGSIAEKCLVFLLLVAVMPLLFCLMAMDYILPKRSGNGLLLTLRPIKP